jgi:hypothetical protein
MVLEKNGLAVKSVKSLITACVQWARVFLRQDTPLLHSQLARYVKVTVVCWSLSSSAAEPLFICLRACFKRAKVLFTKSRVLAEVCALSH